MFVKIFQQIYSSSIAEDWKCRLVFMDMLILADQNGVVDMTHAAIARRTNVPIEIVRDSIAKLELPDPQSRNPKAGGMRLARIDSHRDWGWMIVNYEHYRKIASDEQRREKTRIRVAKFKAANRCNSEEYESGNAVVTLGNAGNAKQKQKQKYKKESADFAAPTIKKLKSSSESQDQSVEKFLELWRAAHDEKFNRAYIDGGYSEKIAIRRLLQESGKTSQELIEIVKLAWSKTGKQFFWCDKLSTIKFFCTHLNEITHEIEKDRRDNPRTIGTTETPQVQRDYELSVRRFKQAERSVRNGTADDMERKIFEAGRPSPPHSEVEN